MRFLSARRDVLLVLTAVALVLGGWYWHRRGDTPQPVGDPDPGGRIMTQLKPTLDAIPAAVHQYDRQIAPPTWDSCDGIASTFGWSDPTVSVEVDHVASPTQFIAQIETALRKQGWHQNTGRADAGPWYWQKKLSGGQTATARLLGGPGFQPPSPWDFQASSPAATHPVTGC